MRRSSAGVAACGVAFRRGGGGGQLGGQLGLVGVVVLLGLGGGLVADAGFQQGGFGGQRLLGAVLGPDAQRLAVVTAG